ncbi:MAG: hypothetical protein Q9218_001228 [Villophora microphyllina]
MAPPESEWMLWAKRLQTSFRAELNEELQTLQNRYAQFATDSPQFDLLKEQVKDLTTSLEHVHQSNQTLRDRLHELEAEATIESKARQETMANLAKQLECVVATFDQFKRGSRANEEKRQTEVLGLRKQIEELTEKTETRKEATTADEGLDVTTIAPKHLPPPQQLNWNISQGRATYAEYLATGEQFIREALEQSEMQAVKAYINGMKQPFRQRAVVEALDTNGWTWQNARNELQKIVDEGKRRRQSRRTIKLPP